MRRKTQILITYQLFGELFPALSRIENKVRCLLTVYLALTAAENHECAAFAVFVASRLAIVISKRPNIGL